MADTLNIPQALKFAFSQAAYVFGINAGPEHLNGCPWGRARVGEVLRDPGGYGCAFMVCGLLSRLFGPIRERAEDGRSGQTFFSLWALLPATLPHPVLRSGWSCAGCMCRWLERCCSFPWIYGELTRGMKKELYLNGSGPGGPLGVYVLLMLPAELFLQKLLSEALSLADQLRYNSLAEENHEKVWGVHIWKDPFISWGNSYK